MNQTNQTYNLNSIAGYQNEKAEAIKIINLFKHYDELKKLGVSIPKGLILSGHPGVGKTLMAKVIAGESNVPFYQYESTEDENSSKRITNLKKIYEEARKNAPSIVFIDELDEILPLRNYRSDTTSTILKTLLTEIDGVNSSDGVLTIATTNSYSFLPYAIKRSRRMDKHIEFPLPEYNSRREILKLYTKDNPLLNKIDISKIARKTQGFSGADLKTLINETLIEVISNNRKEVTTKDVDKTIPLIFLKGIRQVTREEPSKRVCYHEVGHFICHYALTNKPSEISVEKIGEVQGYTSHFLGMGFDDEEYEVEEDFETQTEMENSAIELLGGYASELIFTGELSTGVSSDITQFGELILKMAKIGMLGDEYVFLSSRPMMNPRDMKTEVKGNDPRKEYFTKYLAKAKELINQNKDLALFIFDKLMEKSTLDEEEVQSYIEEFNNKKKL